MCYFKGQDAIPIITLLSFSKERKKNVLESLEMHSPIIAPPFCNELMRTTMAKAARQNEL
jgi:hypothetical protein